MQVRGFRGGLRWSAVAAGIAALVSLPALVSALPVNAAHAGKDPRDLLARTLRGVVVAHQGLAEVRGSLGLPDLPRLESATQLLGDTTRVRVWWAAPQHWRIAVLRPAGERDTYRDGESTWFYDYESDRAQLAHGDPPVRLPRPEDLVPPQVVARLLGRLGGSDRLVTLPSRRVGGREAYGLRVIPGDPRATIGSVDVWADDATGLPLRVEVRAHGSAHAPFVSEFLELAVTPPSAADLLVRMPSTTRTETADDQDVLARFDRRAPWVLPARLAGLSRADDLLTVHSAAVYGSGLVQVAVVPLPSWALEGVLAKAQVAGDTTPVHLPLGDALFVRTPLLHAALVTDSDGEHAYLLAGTVTDVVLRAVTDELLAHKPPRRPGE